MALQYATGSVESNPRKGEAIYETKETLAAPANGNTLLLPDETGSYESVLISLVVTAGTGKVQFTLSNRNDVIAGNAVWYDWDDGVVSGNTNDVLFHASAFRQVNASGTTTIEIRWV